jgi:hypothetical protein
MRIPAIHFAQGLGRNIADFHILSPKSGAGQQSHHNFGRNNAWTLKADAFGIATYYEWPNDIRYMVTLSRSLVLYPLRSFIWCASSGSQN